MQTRVQTRGQPIFQSNFDFLDLVQLPGPLDLKRFLNFKLIDTKRNSNRDPFGNWSKGDWERGVFARVKILKEKKKKSVRGSRNENGKLILPIWVGLFIWTGTFTHCWGDSLPNQRVLLIKNVEIYLIKKTTCLDFSWNNLLCIIFFQTHVKNIKHACSKVLSQLWSA